VFEFYGFAKCLLSIEWRASLAGDVLSAMSESKCGLRKEYLATYFRAELPPEGLPARFGVITGYNPNGQLAVNAVNLQADYKLKESLERSKLPHFRVTGESQNGSHQEPGFGVVTGDPKEIERLAREFEQEALFWIQDGEIFCITVGESSMHRIGPWSERHIQLRASAGSR
jgi:Protein of unknown function (DUF3293)